MLIISGGITAGNATASFARNPPWGLSWNWWWTAPILVPKSSWAHPAARTGKAGSAAIGTPHGVGVVDDEPGSEYGAAGHLDHLLHSWARGADEVVVGTGDQHGAFVVGVDTAVEPGHEALCGAERAGDLRPADRPAARGRRQVACGTGDGQVGGEDLADSVLSEANLQIRQPFAVLVHGRNAGGGVVEGGELGQERAGQPIPEPLGGHLDPGRLPPEDRCPVEGAAVDACRQFERGARSVGRRQRPGGQCAGCCDHRGGRHESSS